MPVDYYPDTTETKFARRQGEFSIKTEEAFEKHLARLWMKQNLKISSEPFWFSDRPEFLEARR